MSLFTRILTTLFLSLALIACGGQAENAGDGETEDVHVHGPDCDHDAEAETTGPNGGALAAFGDGAARLEAIHDDVLGQVTIYILDAEDGMLKLDQAPVLNLVTDEGSLQLKPTQVGSAWVFESDDLLDEPEKARFRVALAGKSWKVDMPCAHGHEHGADCDHEADEHGDEHGEGHDADEHGHHADEGDGHDGDDGHAADHDADDHGHEDGDEDGDDGK